MSFPTVIYKGFGTEKVTQSTKIGDLPLGQLMILPDGRKFRHTQAGGTNLGAGRVVSTSAVQTGHGGVAASGLLASATSTYNAVKDTTVRLLSKSTTFSADQYADGILNVQGPAGSTYIGHLYRIKSNKSCASASELEIELEPSDGLKVAFASGVTFCSLRRNAYRDAIVSASITTVIGATPVAVSASHYFWVQTSGPASLQQDDTPLTDGLGVMPGDIAGSVSIVVASSLETKPIIGQALEGVAASCGVLVDLTIE